MARLQRIEHKELAWDSKMCKPDSSAATAIQDTYPGCLQKTAQLEEVEIYIYI